MKHITITLLAALAAANAGVLPAPQVLEGPSSKTTVTGPDGSQITAFAPGGKILLEENAGPVLQGAPVVVAKEGVAQSLPEVQTQVVEEVAPVEVAADSVSVPATVVEVSKDTELVRSAASESNAIETTTAAATVTEEESSSTPETLVTNTDTPTVEKVSDTPSVYEAPASVVEKSDVPVTEAVSAAVPLVTKIHAPVAVRVVEPRPVLAYINNSPLYIPEFRQFPGGYIPENLFEKEILGW